MVHKQHTIDVDALGCTVRIVAPHFMDRVAEAWSDARHVPDASGSPGPMGARGGPVGGAVSPDAEVTVRGTAGDEQALSVLSSDVTFAALGARRGDALLFHAAGIALDDGRVIAFVGPSGRGKTTLSAELGRFWGYVSDETVAVALDASRRVHPYRKPLSIIRGPGPKSQVAPSNLRLRPLPAAPLRLDTLVLLDRTTSENLPETDADAPTLTAVPRTEAIIALAGESSYLVDLEAPLAQLARLIDDTGGVLRLTYSDVRSVRRLIDEFVSGRVPPAPDAPPIALAPWQPEPLGPHVGPRVRDAIAVDGEVLVLVGDQIHRLEGIGPLLWRYAVLGTDTDSITAAVVDTFGAPEAGDPREIVLDVLARLRRSQLIR